MFYIFLFKNKENIFVFFRCFIPLCILLLEKCRENVSFLVCWYTLPHWGFCPPGTGEVKGG